MTQDNEDYATARTLLEIEHLGLTFRLVKRRHNGKPWRKYVTLAYGPHAVSDAFIESAPEQAADEFRRLLQSHFATRAELLARLKYILPPVRRVHVPME